MGRIVTGAVSQNTVSKEFQFALVDGKDCYWCCFTEHSKRGVPSCNGWSEDRLFQVFCSFDVDFDTTKAVDPGELPVSGMVSILCLAWWASCVWHGELPVSGMVSSLQKNPAKVLDQWILVYLLLLSCRWSHQSAWVTVAVFSVPAVFVCFISIVKTFILHNSNSCFKGQETYFTSVFITEVTWSQ